MLLSQLVAYRAQLDSVTPTEGDHFVRSQLDTVLHTVSTRSPCDQQHVQNLAQARDLIQSAISGFQQRLESIKSDVDAEISRHKPAYLSQSYLLYEQMQKHDSPAYILDRRFNLNEDQLKMIDSRIKRYNTWHHAAMIIRPGREPWIDNMVSFDPLYVIDTDHELFSPVAERFNETYKNRIRWAVIKESDRDPMLIMVPDDQIGLCVVWNFFHFKPFEMIKSYLIEIYQKLRPGGVLAFSFNDCDRPGAVTNAERSFMCYTPGSMICALAESLGFVIEFKYDIDAAATWIEMRKPGQRGSIKGGQALAQIIPKT